MTTQTQPISDGALRSQLARRAGDGSADLTAVLDAIDRVPVRRPVAGIGSRHGRLAGSLAALAAIVALVVVALPALGPRSGPAGPYPPARVMSTAELASALDAGVIEPNATLLVRTSIDVRRDVCPMNRYPTVGVVDGVSPEVCVMGGGHGPLPAATTGRLDGLFVLRFIGGRTLGYLGAVTTPAAGLTYRVADEWPLEGQTFLVDAWLGTTQQNDCPYSATGLDPMSASDVVCWSGDWLSDDGKPLDRSVAAVAPLPSTAAELDLHGDARAVRAGWAADLAGIARSRRLAAPVRGVFAVQSQTAGCPDLPEVSSIGCAVWRVLGRIDTIDPASRPPATASPGPTGSPYRADRPLTTAEFARLLEAPGSANATVAVRGQLREPPTVDACPNEALRPKAHILVGVEPAVCAYTVSDPTPFGPVLVLRRLGDRRFAVLASLDPPATFTVAPSADWPKQPGAMLVRGTLVSASGHCVQVGLPSTAPDPVDPTGTLICGARLTGPQAAVDVDAGPYVGFSPGLPADLAFDGVYVVDYRPRCSALFPTECATWVVLGRLDDGATPTTNPPAQPQAATATPSPRPAAAGSGSLEPAGVLVQVPAPVVETQLP